MADQLSIYNHALLLMKERRLASLTEDREARRVLDEFYTEIKQFCLEQGMWKFAMRSASLTQNGAGLYGFTYSFAKPTDIIHLFSASETSDYSDPLVYNFADEADVYYGNVTPLKVRYSSNGASYGGDLTSWPQGFAQYVATELAAWSSYSITGNERIAMMLDRKSKILLANALGLYSLVAPPGQLPFNSWARSITASEAINMRPEILPFGTEIKALLASEQQPQRGGQQG